MANLRLVRIKASNSQLIRAQFTDNLDQLINTSSVVVHSNTPGVIDAEVLEVTISDDILNVTTRPMTPNAAYLVEFRSTDTSSFKSKDGLSFLLEDGTTNIPLLYGSEDPADPVRDILLGYLQGSVYNFDDRTQARDIVNSEAKNLTKALHDIGQLKNDNYLEVPIIDERKVRGKGPYDRFEEEGAFRVSRVGFNRTDANLSTSINFAIFPKDPITLLQSNIFSERLSAGTGVGTFNNLTLTVGKSPVTKLNKAVLLLEAGGSFEYNLSTLGYQVKNPRYDTGVASALFILDDNQFKLSNVVLEDDTLPVPKSGDIIVVDYEYKSLGRVIDPETVTVSQVLDVTREPVPPITTRFNLQNAPIVTSSDEIPNTGGIEFLDPQSNPPFSATHPAFRKESPFRLESLPRVIGEYSVDYESGDVYVFGAETNDGSGSFPPGATYKYRKLFNSRIDYTFDLDTDPIHFATSTGSDLVANPLRELIGLAVKVSFDFEQTLIPGVDYNPQIHQEILDERIENRLASTGSLFAKNTPITNVFRVYNETSGEIYSINRFSDNTIFFSANTAPRILDVERERATFTNVFNETLLVDSEAVNGSGTRVFTIELANNRIISSTDDVIGSSYNNSLAFSRSDLFDTEIFYDGQILDVTTNTDRLLIGQYQVDYRGGIIYLGVSTIQNLDLGTLNYKKPTIDPDNSHLVSVSELYHSINAVTGVNKRIKLVSFGEDEIVPSSFDISDERFLAGDTSLPYILSNDQIAVTDDIKTVRHIFDAFDLNNNTIPTDFADGSTASGNVITLGANGVEKQELNVIDPGLTIDVTFISSGAEIFEVTSVVRTSDNIELFDGGGSFSGYTITLSGVGSPLAGEQVLVIYRVKLIGASTPIVDYNRGDYFIDYTYLADEILISYEYGDNVLDFRDSGAIDEGKEYFVSYQVGALRDALLKNFGILVDLPILNTFDTSLPRESYRDALQAALQSFTKGPTIPAIKEVVSRISHIDPEIIESAFDIWSLGISHLFKSPICWTGDIALLPGKFDNGTLVSSSDETITFPISNNLRLEEGTWESWIIPEWNGLDNDATLTFSSLKKDGYVLPSTNIFIGASSFNPVYVDNEFSINRTDTLSPIGLPSKIFTERGLFIFYNEDNKVWEMLAKDIPQDGYDGYVYSGQINTSGELYDVKFKKDLKEADDILRSLTNKLTFKFNLNVRDKVSPDGYNTGDGYIAGHSFDGITFMSDELHYIFDFASTNNTNRFSLFKDGRGYLNFHIHNKGNNSIANNARSAFPLSADISGWLAGERHHIAASWRLSTLERRDEIHLFVDGIEVPNMLKYGGRPIASVTDRFRTVSPEVVVGTVPLPTVTNNDLSTVLGSSVVTSTTVNFAIAGIVPGHTIDIIELGFASYTILGVSGQSLTLDSPMPATLSNASFSVNPYAVVVSSEINLHANIAVSIISSGVETEIPGVRADIPSYSIDKNASNEDVLTLLGDALAGDTIVIRTLGLNHRRARERHYIWGNTTNIIKTQLPPPVNLDEVKITPVLLSLESIGLDNSVIVGNTFTASGLVLTQPSNATEGRRLSVRMTGGNVDFSTPATVEIFGTTFGGPVSEVISFTSAGEKITIERFLTVTTATVIVESLTPTKGTVSVEIKEAFSITEPDGNSTFPIILFSFKTQTGGALEGDGGATVQDFNGQFLASDVDNKLVINSPVSVAGTYMITQRIDKNTVVVSPTPASSFIDGSYDIFNVTLGRSGYQNGFFVLETAGLVNTPFNLNEGIYEFDYAAYLEIPFAPTNDLVGHVGSDYLGNHQAKAIIDELRILSIMLTDTRIGESLPAGQKSITSDFSAIRPFEKDSQTLMLAHLDSFPLINDTDFYVSANKEYIQSNDSVNETFNQSLVIVKTPLIFDNDGLLSTASEGTIEFWVSPRFDTINDPNIRFYFDASSNILEEVVSISNGVVKVSGRISSVESIRLQTDSDNSGKNYFIGGSVADDFQTINLGTTLPYQRTPVKVSYTPSGLVDNRISIFKNEDGLIVFNVRVGETDYQVTQSIFWQRDTWHKIRATYKFNRADNQDEIRMFIDGEENGAILFGAGLLFGDGFIFGQGRASADTSRLISDINFTDPINQIFIGSDFSRANIAQARFDNLKISNISLNPLIVAGQPKDVTYTSNISQARPAIPDAFTTFLLDFDRIITKNTNFAILRNEEFGIFNFTLNILDSFGIVLSNAKIEQVLETLILALKPAQSKVTINIIP